MNHELKSRDFGTHLAQAYQLDNPLYEWRIPAALLLAILLAKPVLGF